MRSRLHIFKLLAVVIAFVSCLGAKGQRRITPVDNPSTATQHVNENPLSADSIARLNVVEMTDSQGRIVLVDTITGTEWVDTLPPTRQIPKMEQPLLFSASISADVAAPLMRAFGRKYGLFELGAELNLHNRYIPVIEVGLGKADYKPEDNNYTYKSPISPFFRLGINYNFFYNSNPDYMLFAGVRYGLSPFKFSVTDITPAGGDYWGPESDFSIPSLSTTVGYFQFLLGLKVHIAGGFSLGWTVRYQSILHESACRYGDPWYIPGFGSRGTPISFTFSASYTLRLSKKRVEPALPLDNQLPEPVPEDNGSLETVEQ